MTEFSSVRMDSIENILHRPRFHGTARLTVPSKMAHSAKIWQSKAKYTTSRQSCPRSRHEGIWGSTGIAPFILDVDTREVSGLLDTSVALPNSRRHPLNMSQSGRHSRSRHFGQEDNLLTLSGIETRCISCKARSLVATPTELFRSPKVDT